MLSLRAVTFLSILFVTVIPFTLTDVNATPIVPKWIYHGGVVTDPVNVIWWSNAQSWWVSGLMTGIMGWDRILFCASIGFLDSASTNPNDQQLEKPPDLSCLLGDRYHVRIWGMGYDPVWGYWAVGGVHLEHAVLCGAVVCHVINSDGWELAENQMETDWREAFPSASISSIWIDNVSDLQNQHNDGFAVMIEVPPLPDWATGGGGPGTGSPYLSSWNGSGYSLDNNLLAFEEGLLGVEPLGVEGGDYYRIQSPLVKENGKYKLLLSEFQTERTFFDKVRLLAVDHSPQTGIGLTLGGDVLTYKDPRPAVSVVDNMNISHTSKVEAIDEVSYQATNGSSLFLDFGQLNASQGTRLLIRSDIPPYKLSILVQVRDATFAWKNTTLVVPRAYWSTDAVELSQYLPDPFGEFKVRLFFTAPHRVDYVAIDTTAQESVVVSEAELVSASHSTNGNVKTALLASDNVYSSIFPGEQIQVSFRIGTKEEGIRDFIIYVEGYVLPAP